MNTNENSFALMYEALTDALGTNPDNFQLITPPTDWNWKVGNTGETYSQQYSFLNAMPYWSPVGKYQSGSSFSEAYKVWLNTLVVDADSQLENRITKQVDILTAATNDYNQQVSSGMEAYKQNVKDNDPTFEEWLNSIFGKAYGTKILAAEKYMNKQQSLYNDLVKQANDPIVNGALSALEDESFYTKVISSTTSNNYMAPGYGEIPVYSKWVQENAGGSEVSISWKSDQESSIFEKSFAGGSVSVGNWFYSVKVNGKWEKVKQLDTSSGIQVTITFKPWGRVAITPNPWYSEATIKAKANNKDAYRAGYAPYKEDGQAAWIFGEGGIMPARPTDMIVAYQPTFSIKTNSSFSNKEMEQFQAATQVRIGPFTFSGSGGKESSYADKKITSSEISGKSVSEFPVVLGVELKVFGEPNLVSIDSRLAKELVK